MSNLNKAFNTMHSNYGQKLFTVCLQFGIDIQDAEDIFQDAMIKIFMKRASYKATGSYESWLYTIVVRTAINHYRRNKLRAYTPLDDVPNIPDSNETIMATIGLNEIMEAVNRLPIGQQTVFKLFAIEGYSHNEIAEMHGVSEGTSKSQYSRAREKLRAML